MVTVRADVGHERKCPVCGKHFICYPEWVYRRGSGDGTKTLCSWHCLREFDKTHMTKSQQQDAVKALLIEGKFTREIVEELSVQSRTVYYWRSKLEKEGLL